MACSEKKRLSNAANSLKSTGPKSKDGKRKVALNSLKHGLPIPGGPPPRRGPRPPSTPCSAPGSTTGSPADRLRRVLVEQCMAHAYQLAPAVPEAQATQTPTWSSCGQDAACRHEAASRRACGRGRQLPAQAARPPPVEGPLQRAARGRGPDRGPWDGSWARRPGRPRPGRDLEAHHARLRSNRRASASIGDARPTLRRRRPPIRSWCLMVWNEPKVTAYAEDRPADEAAADALAAELSDYIAGEVAKLRTYLAPAVRDASSRSRPGWRARRPGRLGARVGRPAVRGPARPGAPGHPERSSSSSPRPAIDLASKATSRRP